jgi:Pentapeptide repeats (8 copies)
MSMDFSYQDLRDRSFKGQDLTNANFQGADLRGCDFSHAQLTGANFQNIRTGRTPKQVLPFLLLFLIVALPLFDAISRLIFAALGQTPEDSGWTYVLVLYSVLGIAGISESPAPRSRVSLRNPTSKTRRMKIDLTLRNFFRALSAAASGALAGFFYGGNWTQNDPRFATIGAILCGLLAAAASSWKHPGIALTTARAIARYGLAFLLAAIALNHLSTQNPWGLFWAFLSMLYIQFTITALLSLLQQFKKIGGTSFKNVKGLDALTQKSGFFEKPDF